MKVTLLGTGTSTGVPVIGCTCRVCRSENPKDKRLRCSCFIEIDGVHILIDAGPDFRAQAFRAGIRRVDALLLTHHHFDHVVGLDDLRPFFFENRSAIPCFAHPESAIILRKMFGYIFDDGSYPGVANLSLKEVGGPFEVSSRYEASRPVEITPIEAYHGAMPVLGFRIGKFAYVTDTNHIPEKSLLLLHDLDVLVLDALRYEPHRTHFTIPEAIALVGKIRPKQTYFTHMTHSILHDEQNALLPEGMELAYDGLCFTVG